MKFIVKDGIFEGDELDEDSMYYIMEDFWKQGGGTVAQMDYATMFAWYLLGRIYAGIPGMEQENE